MSFYESLVTQKDHGNFYLLSTKIDINIVKNTDQLCFVFTNKYAN